MWVRCEWAKDHHSLGGAAVTARRAVENWGGQMPTDEIVLYRSVASRSITPLWMLEELGLAYKMETVDIRTGAQKDPAYLRLNPMGKVPTLTVGETVVTETAAICLFLADRYSYGAMAPTIEDPARGAFLRWTVFATAVLEPAMIAHELGLEAPAHHIGWGAYEDAVHTTVSALGDRSFLLGERFTAADVMLGSVIAVGLFTKRLPAEAALVAYNTRLGARPAFQKAAAINWPPELFAQS